MTNPANPNAHRMFRCGHCKGGIQIPKDLPPTTAPCPHCGKAITSPPLDPAAAPQQPAPVSAPQPPAPAPAVRQPRPAPAINDPPVPKPPSTRLVRDLLLFSLVALLLGVALFFAVREMRRPPDPGTAKPSVPEDIKELQYLRIGWQQEAYRTLGEFIAAETPDGKMPHILNPEQLAPELRQFYGNLPIDDTGTPAEAFSVHNLSLEDRKRGLFLLIYDQPPQFKLRDFFRPLAPLEVQHEPEEADLLLSTMARASNFAMEPVNIHAFFKRTPDGLKLDWEIYKQTKYRTLLEFVENPSPGRIGTFRVIVVEDVADRGRDVAGSRTYRLADPANVGDSVRVAVPIDSDIGRTLAALNWRGTKEGRPEARTATVELQWTDTAQPVLTLHRFICWEFLGLGGDENPAAPAPR